MQLQSFTLLPTPTAAKQEQQIRPAVYTVFFFSIAYKLCKQSFPQE